MGRIKFASYNIDVEELTVKELKDYIRNGVDFINDYLDEVEELRKPQKNFLKEIENQTTRGRFGKALGYGLNMKKDDLINKAQSIEKFILLSKDYDVEKVNKAYETFKNIYGDISKEKYNKIINTFSGLSDDIKEKFGSNQIVALVMGSEKIPSYKIADYIMNAVNNKTNITQQDMIEEVKDNIKKYINRTSKLKK